MSTIARRPISVLQDRGSSYNPLFSEVLGRTMAWGTMTVPKCLPPVNSDDSSRTIDAVSLDQMEYIRQMLRLSGVHEDSISSTLETLTTVLTTSPPST